MDIFRRFSYGELFLEILNDNTNYYMEKFDIKYIKTHIRYFTSIKIGK